jgi:hypothetical protein
MTSATCSRPASDSGLDSCASHLAALEDRDLAAVLPDEGERVVPVLAGPVDARDAGEGRGERAGVGDVVVE